MKEKSAGNVTIVHELLWCYDIQDKYAFSYIKV